MQRKVFMTLVAKQYSGTFQSDDVFKELTQVGSVSNELLPWWHPISAL